MGWIKDKGSLPQFQEGGNTNQVNLKGFRERGIDSYKDDDGNYVVKGIYDIPTNQIGGEGGSEHRMFEGLGKSSDLNIAKNIAENIALAKMASSPGDSLKTTDLETGNLLPEFYMPILAKHYKDAEGNEAPLWNLETYEEYDVPPESYLAPAKYDIQDKAWAAYVKDYREGKLTDEMWEKFKPFISKKEKRKRRKKLKRKAK